MKVEKNKTPKIVFDKYLVKKKITLNLSVISKAQKPELADNQVEKFVKRILDKFVSKLVSDKIVKSYDDFDISTRILTKLDDDDKSPTFEESYDKLKKQLLY
jgi:hypothetical protein|tara:strand:- start:75 stop:380 length:306 start_codon:yes stop_codon:yes gene_type:complete